MATFEEQVNDTVSKMVEVEGKWDFPEDLELSEEVKYAANLERRRRDTQASFSKEQQRADKYKAENEAIYSSWEQDVVKNLTPKQQADLEELKSTDPEAWRTKLTTLEEENKTNFKTKREELSSKITKETEIQRRSRLLDEYNEKNPDHQLTDEVIENDLPPRLLKQLETGDIDFEQFIDKSSTYLNKPKKMGTDDADENEPNLSDLPGNGKPSDKSVGADISKSYEKEVF